ncbi:MAG TPA: 5'/3'-nucleotidase SurE [Anaerolineae bacterium]|jgi:5'-nucleotidase|nr:5'/3'-nucleotidase SurE [Anaerolineae bacterium]
MNILLTNDDGYAASGLLILKQALDKLGTVKVVAPDQNWSAGGHVKTMHKPLRLNEIQLADGTSAYASSGAPSDCIALVLLGAIDFKPDLIVSGINPNPNLGQDVTYSGTVTAAMEGTLGGIPSIAVSVESNEAYASAAEFVGQLIPIVLQKKLPPNILLNVNVPSGSIKGVQVTRLGQRVYNDELVTRLDPRGKPYYWIGGEAPSGVPDDGTDLGALHNGFISITPIQLDMTAIKFLDELTNWPLPDR